MSIMMRRTIVTAAVLCVVTCAMVNGNAEEALTAQQKVNSEYKVGVNDVLDIAVLQPEKIVVTVPVAMDGTITFPYIGTVQVSGMSLSDIQRTIETRLADGYMKYPAVTVTLRESHSMKFFVYGEVARPGMYPMEKDLTMLKAISMAGGITKFGSARTIKLLRSHGGNEYTTVKVNVNAILKSDNTQDIAIQPGDIIVVSEGIL